VGKLSDVRRAVEDASKEAGLEINALVTVADASKIKMYMKNFGEFYNNQIENAGAVILSRTQKLSQEKQLRAAELIREKNPKAVVITTPWDDITGGQILKAIEGTDSLAKELMEEAEHHHHHHDEECGCGHDHEHHHHGHDEECGCDHDHEEHDHEHHHGHDEECGCGHDHEEHDHEHHHGHDEECGCGHDHEEHDHEHHHHYDENGVCSCGHHHDEDGHHHHHHADEVFTSWGRETPRKYTKDELEQILKTLSDSEEYGIVLRAKGMLPDTEGTWLHFDLVPGEYEIRNGSADYTGRLCVIGSKLDEAKLEKLFLL